MPHAKQYVRTGLEANAGPHLDSDLNLLFAWDNAHEADTTTHGATGAIVGTTNTQTLSNKTLTSPVVNQALNLSAQYEAFAASANATASTVICGVTALAADVAINLLSAEIAKVGRLWMIQDEVGTCGNAFTISVTTEGAETINGLASVTIVENYGTLMLYSNGTNLFIVG